MASRESSRDRDRDRGKEKGDREKEDGGKGDHGGQFKPPGSSASKKSSKDGADDSSGPRYSFYYFISLHCTQYF